jgi:hypothetical protein
MTMNNPVAKHSPTFNKPKTFRDRKKEAKKDGDYAEHPRHRPYKRKDFNWRVVVTGEDDAY